MKIVDLHFYTGRNIYSHYPVRRHAVDRNFPGLSYRRDLTLPTAYRAADIREHSCSRRRRAVLSKLKEGTYLGMWLSMSS